MQKATTDDIGAICSRIDAQTIVLIEMMADMKERNTQYFSEKYQHRYAILAEEFRKTIIDR